MTPLFKRNDKTTIAELEEYYANQKSKRTGMAWFMALLSILITLAVLVALFFGGRWLYRTLLDNGSNDTAIVNDVDMNGTTLPSFDGDLPNQTGDGTANDTSVEPDGVVSEEAARTDQARDNQDDAGSASQTPGTGGELPDTGANELVMLVPIATGVAGYTISRRRQLR